MRSYEAGTPSACLDRAPMAVRGFAAVVGFIGLSLLASAALAHEIRPGYLALTERSNFNYELFWRVPAQGGRRLGIDPQLPANCRQSSAAETDVQPSAVSMRISVTCTGGLDGRPINIAGLPAALTDVLVRIERQDGTSQVELLTPSRPTFNVSAQPSTRAIAATYLHMGVEHILTGYDHLLFIIAILMVVDGWRRRLILLTAFTAAHSVTLVAATLGFVHASPMLIEAAIALSIVCVAAEINNRRSDRVSWTSRWPTLIAFAFGLLHGAGFAGALAEMGLPEHSIPLALLCFNAGIELGQLAVLGVVVLLTLVWNRWLCRWTEPMRTYAGYSIGTIAAFWFFQRVASFM